MKTLAHAIAGTLAMLLVVAFLGGTLYAELAMDPELILDVKRMILYGVCLLIPAMAVTGGSGFSLAAGRSGGLIDVKKRRMRLIAANGLAVMLPSAIALYVLASGGHFGPLFVAVQIVEIVGGVLQLSLLGRNFRDGLALTARRRRGPPAKTKTAG